MGESESVWLDKKVALVMSDRVCVFFFVAEPLFFYFFQGGVGTPDLVEREKNNGWHVMLTLFMVIWGDVTLRTLVL